MGRKCNQFGDFELKLNRFYSQLEIVGCFFVINRYEVDSNEKLIVKIRSVKRKSYGVL